MYVYIQATYRIIDPVAAVQLLGSKKEDAGAELAFQLGEKREQLGLGMAAVAVHRQTGKQEEVVVYFGIIDFLQVPLPPSMPYPTAIPCLHTCLIFRLRLEGCHTLRERSACSFDSKATAIATTPVCIGSIHPVRGRLSRSLLALVSQVLRHNLCPWV